MDGTKLENDVETGPQEEISQPWIFTIDNIFMDVARQLPSNDFLLQNNVVPGSQNTATNDHLKSVAKKILEMQDGDYGSKELSKTVGGAP